MAIIQISAPAQSSVHHGIYVSQFRAGRSAERRQSRSGAAQAVSLDLDAHVQSAVPRRGQRVRPRAPAGVRNFARCRPTICAFASVSATAFSTTRRTFWCMRAISGCSCSQKASPTCIPTFLDVGVGCGRWAHWLRDYNFRGRRFAGSYVGVDIDEEAIAWCRQHYDADRFRF
jgi:Methyltransferase domain